MPETGSREIEVSPARTGMLLLAGLATLIALTALAVAIGGYFWLTRDRVVLGSQASILGTGLSELRALESRRLSTYAKVGDQYQIPIERAMELVAREGL